MTPAQIWLVEPTVGMALLGAGLILGSLFRGPLFRLWRWLDRQPAHVLGALILVQALAFAALVWGCS